MESERIWVAVEYAANPDHHMQLLSTDIEYVLATSVPNETVEGALAKLREKYPGKQIAIDRTGGDGYIFQGRIELRRERWSIRMDVFVSLGSGKTLAEALVAALAAKRTLK